MKISEKTNLREIIMAYPETAEIFQKRGMGCIGCAIAQFETIGEGARAHGFENKQVQELISDLKKKVDLLEKKK